MNEKCGSKQTVFEHTWLCNEKFTILNQENNLSVRIEKDKNKKVFRTASQNVDQGNFLDIFSTHNFLERIIQLTNFKIPLTRLTKFEINFLNMKKVEKKSEI